MRISDWSSDVCSSDLRRGTTPGAGRRTQGYPGARLLVQDYPIGPQGVHAPVPDERRRAPQARLGPRSEEHTSELQSLMRISYAVFCLKKKNKKITATHHTTQYNYTYIV